MNKKATTHWLNARILEKINRLQQLRSDSHRGSTVNFLLLKSLGELGMLTPEEMKALDLGETDFEQIFNQQVKPLLPKLKQLWSSHSAKWFETFLPFPVNPKSVLEFGLVSKETQYAFYAWLKENGKL